MINLDQSKKYQKLEFKIKKKDAPAIVEEQLKKEIERKGEINKEITKPFEVDTYIGKMGLDDFVDSFEQYRNILTEKCLRGKKLTAEESYNLRIMNEKLDELIGYNKPQDHIEVKAWVREAQRYLARR